MTETITDIEAIARFYRCAWAGHEVVDVWEPAQRYYDGLPPNRTGCIDCSYFGKGENDEMVRIRWPLLGE